MGPTTPPPFCMSSVSLQTCFVDTGIRSTHHGYGPGAYFEGSYRQLVDSVGGKTKSCGVSIAKGTHSLPGRVLAFWGFLLKRSFRNNIPRSCQNHPPRETDNTLVFQRPLHKLVPCGKPDTLLDTSAAHQTNMRHPMPCTPPVEPLFRVFRYRSLCKCHCRNKLALEASTAQKVGFKYQCSLDTLQVSLECECQRASETTDFTSDTKVEIRLKGLSEEDSRGVFVRPAQCNFSGRQLLKLGWDTVGYSTGIVFLGECCSMGRFQLL